MLWELLWKNRLALSKIFWRSWGQSQMLNDKLGDFHIKAKKNDILNRKFV